MDEAEVPTDDMVDAFWAWFEANASTDPEDPVFLIDLDRRVAGLGCPAWEIGPGAAAPWFLALSPDGDPAGLELTRALVGRAPAVRGWEFLSSRPIKVGWDLQFDLSSNDGPVLVDARSWRYVAYRYPDGRHDILIEVGDDPRLASDHRETAAHIVVQGMLGEERWLTLIAVLEVVVELSPTERRHARSVRELGRLGGDSGTPERG